MVRHQGLVATASARVTQTIAQEAPGCFGSCAGAPLSDARPRPEEPPHPAEFAAEIGYWQSIGSVGSGSANPCFRLCPSRGIGTAQYLLCRRNGVAVRVEGLDANEAGGRVRGQYRIVSDLAPGPWRILGPVHRGYWPMRGVAVDDVRPSHRQLQLCASDRDLNAGLDVASSTECGVAAVPTDESCPISVNLHVEVVPAPVSRGHRRCGSVPRREWASARRGATWRG